MDKSAVKFSLPFGEIFVQIPEATSAIRVRPLLVDHLLVELRTRRGELISVAAYRDVSALLGREVPIVWATSANGVPVRVTEHAQLPPSDVWWNGILERVLARASSSNGDLE